MKVNELREIIKKYNESEKEKIIVELYKRISKKTKENLKYCIELLNAKYDPQEYHKLLLYSFESCLKTADARYMAIELLKEQVSSWKEKYKKDDSYESKDYANYFIECIVDIYFELREAKEGIEYFHKQYLEQSKEVKEYIILEQLEAFELYKEWILEYEKYLGKIEYRNYLKEKYNEFKNGEK